MKKQFKYALLGMLILPLIGRVALYVTGLTTDAFRLLMPMLVGGATGFLIGRASDRLLSRSHQLLRESEEKYRALLQGAGDAIFIAETETGILIDANQRAETLVGRSREEIIGMHQSQLHPETDIERYRKIYRRNMKSGGGIISESVFVRHHDGRKIPVEISTGIAQVDGRKIMLGVYRDITERQLLLDKMQIMAHTDELTRLPNRHLFYERFRRAKAQAHRNQQCFALMALDLDDFKSINDVLGHQAGDTALFEVAQRLQACVREVDTVARMGGDEFLVILTDIQGPRNAALVAEKIISSLDQPFDLQGKKMTIGCSIGISLYPSDAEDVDALVHGADLALYLAKKRGKNNFQFYRPNSL